MSNEKPRASKPSMPPIMDELFPPRDDTMHIQVRPRTLRVERLPRVVREELADILERPIEYFNPYINPGVPGIPDTCDGRLQFAVFSDLSIIQRALNDPKEVQERGIELQFDRPRNKFDELRITLKHHPSGMPEVVRVITLRFNNQNRVEQVTYENRRLRQRPFTTSILFTELRD